MTLAAMMVEGAMSSEKGNFFTRKLEEYRREADLAANKPVFDGKEFERAVADGAKFQEEFQKLIEREMAESYRIEFSYGLRTIGFEPGDDPYTLKRVLEPVPQPAYSDIWDLLPLSGVVDAFDKATGGLVSREAMKPPEVRYGKRYGKTAEMLMGIDLALHGDDKAVCALVSRDSNGELKTLRIENLAVSADVPEGGVTAEELEGYSRELAKCLEYDSMRVGSVDLCIKHRYRGTAEQPGCPECKGDDFFMNLASKAGTEIRHMGDWPTEAVYTTRYGSWTSEAPKLSKRSDEPVPDWLKGAQQSPMMTVTRQVKACGCHTINGITFSCIACAKGGV
jgi:hypothetical protein